jgi:hypothetical protein
VGSWSSLSSYPAPASIRTRISQRVSFKSTRRIRFAEFIWEDRKLLRTESGWTVHDSLLLNFRPVSDISNKRDMCECVQEFEARSDEGLQR